MSDLDKALDDALNTVIAALRGTEAARLLTDVVGGGVERLRTLLWSERELTKKLTAEYSASRVGIMARQGELHEHLALMVRYFEEEASSGDGIREEHFDGYEAAKALLTRSSVDQPQWENAQLEVAGLLRKTSELPGLTAELDRLRWERDRAVELLHMIDRHESRHPDIGEFLDGLEGT